jgi:hypothetical protein
MRKLLTILALMLFALPLALAGCGETEQADSEADAVEKIATHDCDGGCGMKDVSTDQLKEIDGKFYCAGCAQKVEKEEDHSGHDHG